MSTMNCADCTSLLPWLLNDSLEVEERRSVLVHLEACASCRTELAETWEIGDLLGSHVPSLPLAAHAHGLPSAALDARAIEAHLAICPSCREEAEGAMADRVVVFDSRSRRPARSLPAGWMAFAAALVLALASAPLLWQSRDSEPAVQNTTTETLDPQTLFSDGFEAGTVTAWSGPNERL